MKKDLENTKISIGSTIYLRHRNEDSAASEADGEKEKNNEFSEHSKNRRRSLCRVCSPDGRVQGQKGKEGGIKNLLKKDLENTIISIGSAIYLRHRNKDSAASEADSEKEKNNEFSEHSKNRRRSLRRVCSPNGRVQGQKGKEGGMTG